MPSRACASEIFGDRIRGETVQRQETKDKERKEIDMKLDDKVVVITGGSSGIGLATAHELRANGARVALFARDAQSLGAARDALGDDVVTVAGDVRNLADLDRLFDETERRLGKIDVVVAARSYLVKTNGYETTTQPPPSGLGKLQVSGRSTTQCSTESSRSSELTRQDVGTRPEAEIPNLTIIFPAASGRVVAMAS
jgi:hypothetical protein